MSKNLKHLKKYFKEIEKSEVLKLPVGTVYIVYNPLTDNSKEEIANPIDIAHNKFCYENLKFFIKDGEK